MAAFVRRGAGSDDVGPAEVPVPAPGRDELLVRVRAVDVGIHDSYFLPDGNTVPFPIGIEAAGVVEEVGGGVVSFRPGDPIAFVSSMQRKGGTWAEYAVVRADSLILPIPPGMSFTQAAAVPVAGNTVARVFRALATVPAGSSAFIAGGSGAIGTFAIQMGRARGWEVAASASRANHDYMSSLGAAKTVDYRDPDWPEQLRQWAPEGVDAAIAIQPGTAAESLQVVRDGGRLIAVSGDQLPPQRRVQAETVSHLLDVHDELVQLMHDIAGERIRLVVERVYPFAEAQAALAKVQTRHAQGKVVLSLGADAMSRSR
jgi:NADPH:quinone reductase-like Zn-dependent oxidoreductase